MLTDGVTSGRWQLAAWLVAEDRDTPYDGSQTTPNPLQERTTIRVWLVSGDVRIGRGFGVQVTGTIPDITRSAVVPSGATSFRFSETFRGAGDTSVLVWRRFAASSPWTVTLNAGASLPTGKAERPRFAADPGEGSLVPFSRLQRGSGTIDPLVGVSVNRVVRRVFAPGVRVFSTAAMRLPVAENEYGLRTGASVEIGAGLSREVRWHWLVLLGRLSWLHREPDVFQGTPVLVGGGDWLSLAAGAAVQRGPSSVQFEIKAPVRRALANRQLDSSAVFQVGFTRVF